MKEKREHFSIVFGIRRKRVDQNFFSCLVEGRSGRKEMILVL